MKDNADTTTEQLNRELPGLLLAWYDRQARTLPWRSLPTPYRVWVSEIMLQQTRVEAALPYFERFLAALPDVRSLAEADEEQLMKLWEGLGYYSRARNLQRAARIVMERLGGDIPGSVEQLSELPGVGDYTAGAIASIAFGRPAEAVDGNVLRVLSRLLASRDDVTQAGVKQRNRRLIRGVLPADRPGDFNQALMDLGATVCLPNGEPLCPRCPLGGICLGRAQGVAPELPVKKAKKPRAIERRTVFVVARGGKVLLIRRPARGLLAGLWELPSVPNWLDQAGAADALARLGATVRSLTALPAARHVFSHIEWHMHGWLAETQGFTPPAEHLWADGDALRESVALPSAFKAYEPWLPQRDSSIPGEPAREER